MGCWDVDRAARHPPATCDRGGHHHPGLGAAGWPRWAWDGAPGKRPETRSVARAGGDGNSRPCAARAPAAAPFPGREVAARRAVKAQAAAHRRGTDDDAIRAAAQGATPAGARARVAEAGTAAAAVTRAAARLEEAVDGAPPGAAPNGRPGDASVHRRAATRAVPRLGWVGARPSAPASRGSWPRPNSSSRRARHGPVLAASPGTRPRARAARCR